MSSIKAECELAFDRHRDCDASSHSLRDDRCGGIAYSRRDVVLRSIPGARERSVGFSRSDADTPISITSVERITHDDEDSRTKKGSGQLDHPPRIDGI